uniref:Uncharacterized protein n=1 Tax=Acrobeloides nanus TaxID=290746 RepID=A0A914ECM6_9BILA
MAYNIMVAVGLMDLYTLTGYMMMGLQLIFDKDFGFAYEKITGGLVSGGFQDMVIFSILLTINRSNSIMGYLDWIISDVEKFWKYAEVFNENLNSG